MKKHQKIDDLYIQCDCGSEHVFMTPQDQEMWECGIYLAILTNQYNKDSFWHRFKHIWHILIHGVPYTDQVCLDYNKVKELNKYLTDYIALTDLVIKTKKQSKKGVK